MEAKSIYRPKYTVVDDIDTIKKFIVDNNFATVISSQPDSEIPHVTVVPVLLAEESLSKEPKPEGVQFYLRGHLALANPHWRRMQENKELLVVFNGPHAYISPSWLSSAKEQVPTWDYTLVHARGSPVVYKDDKEVKTQIVVQLSKFEEARVKARDPSHQEWELYSTNSVEHINQQIARIVAFEVAVTSVTAKFKLGQNLAEDDYAALKEQHTKTNNPIAKYMK